jgi:hypothetical protein
MLCSKLQQLPHVAGQVVGCKEAVSEGSISRSVRTNARRVITSVGPHRLGLAALKLKDKPVYNMRALSAAPDA